MITIYLNKERNEGHSFEEFNDKFLSICNEHQEQDRALAFAFILYDFNNPQVKKVLNDDDYWYSLNKLSSNYLTIFSIHQVPEKRRELHPGLKGRIGNRGPVYHMESIPTFNDFTDASNLLINKYFDTVGINYPCILFFQVLDELIIDAFVIELDNKFIEGSFESAVNAMKKILPEYRKNYSEIFNCLRINIDGLTFLKKSKNLITKGKSILGIAKALHGL